MGACPILARKGFRSCLIFHPGEASCYVLAGGGPSHVDLFDPKPVMEQMAVKKFPSPFEGQRVCRP